MTIILFESQPTTKKKIVNSEIFCIHDTIKLITHYKQKLAPNFAEISFI